MDCLMQKQSPGTGYHSAGIEFDTEVKRRGNLFRRQVVPGKVPGNRAVAHLNLSGKRLFRPFRKAGNPDKSGAEKRGEVKTFQGLFNR